MNSEGTAIAVRRQDATDAGKSASGGYGLGRAHSGENSGGRSRKAAAPDPMRDSHPGGRPGVRKRPPKLYRIGEVTEYSGLSRQTVHNYTIMGLLHEARWTEGGHRLYDESVFTRLDLVADLKAAGRNMTEIREHCVRLDDALGENSAENAKGKRKR